MFPGGIRKIGKDDSGATLAEFTILLPVLLLIVFAVVELSSVMWQRQVAEFATSRALRIATTRALIPTGALPDCGVATAAQVGTLCSQVSGAEDWVLTCTPSSPNICDQQVLMRMLTEIRSIAPQVEATNLEVQVEGSGLGFVGRGHPVPLVTVRVTRLGYQFMALGPLLGLGDLVMRDISASAPAEDMRGG